MLRQLPANILELVLLGAAEGDRWPSGGPAHQKSDERSTPPLAVTFGEDPTPLTDVQVRQLLASQFNLSTEKKEKPIMRAEDLFELLKTLWVSKEIRFSHERHRVQMALIIQLAGITENPPGALLALRYKHIKVTGRRRTASSVNRDTLRAHKGVFRRERCVSPLLQDLMRLSSTTDKLFKERIWYPGHSLRTLSVALSSYQSADLDVCRRSFRAFRFDDSRAAVQSSYSSGKKPDGITPQRREEKRSVVPRIRKYRLRSSNLA